MYFSRFGMFGPRKIWQPCSALKFFLVWFIHGSH
jgi:hypothetical protein